jgi:hypothetical protein
VSEGRLVCVTVFVGVEQAGTTCVVVWCCAQAAVQRRRRMQALIEGVGKETVFAGLGRSVMRWPCASPGMLCRTRSSRSGAPSSRPHKG